MNKSDFQINFIWPLIVFIGTFIVSDYSLNYACQITLIYILIVGIFRFCKIAFHTFKEVQKKQWKISSNQKKSILTVLTIFLFIALASGIFVLDKTRYFSTEYSLHKLNGAIKVLPQKTLEAAITTLKNNPNDMRYCAPLFFPSLKKNDPEAIATYLAYYALSTKYCQQYWDWGRENCGYLHEFNYGTRALEGRRNIKLCEYAKNNALINKLISSGGLNGQTK